MQDYVDKARDILTLVIADELESRGRSGTDYKLYLETFFVLKRNWRVIFRTSMSNKVYYEITYDRSSCSTTVRKCEVTQSLRISDDEYERIIHPDENQAEAGR